MSMRNSGASGYVLPVLEIVPLLPTEALQQAFCHLLETGQPCEIGDEVLEFLDKYLLPTVPRPSEFFELNDTDESDDLEHGTGYLQFDEEDLFEKTPKAAFTSMITAGVEPTFNRWVTFG